VSRRTFVPKLARRFIVSIGVFCCLLLVGYGIGIKVTLSPVADAKMPYVIKQTRKLTLETAPSAIAWSVDGKQIAALSNLFRRVTVWNSDSGEISRQIETAQSLLSSNSLAFTPDGRSILVAADIGDVLDKHVAAVFWDVKTGTPAEYVAIPFKDGHYRGNIIKVFAISHNGKYLAFNSSTLTGKQIVVYSNRDWGTPFILSTENDIPKCMEFSPDGRQLAVGTFAGSVFLFDVQDRNLIRVMRVYEAGGYGVFSLALSPDGHRLATGYGGPLNSRPGQISPGEPLQLLDTLTGAVLAKSRTSSPTIRSISWSNDGKILAAGDDDRHVAFRTADSLSQAADDLVLAGPVLSLSFAPDKPVFAAVSDKALVVDEIARR
jgi:WD40 repeat protein